MTITVNLPAGTAANIVPGSFNVPPTQINTSASGDSLVWDRSFASGNTAYTFSWQSPLSGVQAGQTVPVTLGATAAFTVLGTPGTLSLPGTSVTGAPIISLAPTSATAQPGVAATYDVQLSNPTSSSVTYYLSQSDNGGIEDATFSSYSVAVPAEGTADVSLQMTSYASDAAGPISFTVTATAYTNSGTGAVGSAAGTLIVAGSPLPTLNPNAYGVVATLTPSSATAGQETIGPICLASHQHRQQR